jgi:hypothetical protein
LAMQRGRIQFGDSFVQSFRVPAFYASRAEITTNSNIRVIKYSLIRFGASQAEWQNTLDRILPFANNLGIDARISDQNSTLTITIPFEDAARAKTRQEYLASALGDAPEWALVRAVLSPKELVWTDNKQPIAETVRYQENVDLAGACAIFNAQVQAIARNLGSFENASDEESQAKRALLQNAQRGWQSAATLGRAVYHAGAEEFPIEPCAAREITSMPVAIQALGYLAILVMVSLIGFGWLQFIRSRKRRSD